MPPSTAGGGDIVFRSSGRLSVRRPLTPFRVTRYLSFLEEVLQRLAQMFITWVGTAENVFEVRGQPHAPSTSVCPLSARRRRSLAINAQAQPQSRSSGTSPSFPSFLFPPFLYSLPLSPPRPLHFLPSSLFLLSLSRSGPLTPARYLGDKRCKHPQRCPPPRPQRICRMSSQVNVSGGSWIFLLKFATHHCRQHCLTVNCQVPESVSCGTRLQFHSFLFISPSRLGTGILFKQGFGSFSQIKI